MAGLRDRTGRVAGLLDPTAAQRPIKVDQVGEAREARGYEGKLRVVVAGLRSEHREIVVHAVSIAEVGKLQRALLRGGIALGGGDLVVEGAARRQAVRDFAEGPLDRLL